MSWFKREPKAADLTKLEELTDQLATSRTRLDDFFMLSRDLFMIIDATGHISRVNPEWENVLGYTPAEMEGRPFYDFLDPADIERTKEQYELRSRVSTTGREGYVNSWVPKNGGPSVKLVWRSSPSVRGYVHATARVVHE